MKKQKLSEEEIEKQNDLFTLNYYKKHGYTKPPEFKLYTPQEIDQAREEIFIQIDREKRSLLGLIVFLIKIYIKNPKAVLVDRYGDDGYNGLQIHAGLETFEQAKNKLKARAEEDFELHKLNYAHFLELEKKYGKKS